MRAHFLERHQKTLEIGVAIQGLGFRQRGLVAVTLAQLEQRRWFDRALQVQMQLGLRKLTDEGVGRAV